MRSWSFACVSVAALACACAGAGRATPGTLRARAEHRADPRIVGEFAIASPQFPIELVDGWAFDIDARLWLVVAGSRVHRYDLAAGTHAEIFVDESTRPSGLRDLELNGVLPLCDGSAAVSAGFAELALRASARETFATWLCEPTHGVVEAGGQRMLWQPSRLRVLDANGGLVWNAWPPAERPRLAPLAAGRLATGEWVVDEWESPGVSRPYPPRLGYEWHESIGCRVWSASGVRGERYQARAGRSGRWSWRGGRVDPETMQVAVELVERSSGRDVVVPNLGHWDPTVEALHNAVLLMASEDSDSSRQEIDAEQLAEAMGAFGMEWPVASFDFLVSPDGSELWRVDRARWCVVRYALPAPAASASPTVDHSRVDSERR
ncbi:MAG: hypothetical protein EPO68_01490 [Planctomycetota bacterium]|nr:MAG: hypothetical protein EPO68_01490 [Planctomycetota bacterium]